jgi:serine/threonine protein kinase
VSILNDIHDLGYIHRDINPYHILLGPGEDWSNLYLIDFSIAKFVDQQKRIFNYKASREKCGMIEFSSVSAMVNNIYSYRDDLEALGYTLLFLYKDTLPWIIKKPKGDKADIIQMMKTKKLETTIKTIFSECP